MKRRGGKMDWIAYLVLLLVWVVAAAATGAALALLAKRMHPTLSFRKLWVFYSTLMAVAVAGVLIIAWF
ncbi:MAG: hypothetical protein HY704_12520 [Gemmatimonadetes bacterium]|nr:hypothetical protein [Gemmatimonadota bacterium]